MSLFTSSQFASAAASGTDWRDTAKAVLEQLESVKTENADFNLGFLYITDHLSDDAESILNLFKSVLDIEDWIGAVAVGICTCGEEFIDKPAISAMIGRFDADDFRLFPPVAIETQEAADTLNPWLSDNDPMLVFVHGDPLAEEDPAQSIKALNRVTGGFMIGGLSSSRHEQIQFSKNAHSGGVSGAVFSQNVKVATALSQGCTPIGAFHTITRGDESLVLELDGQRAVSIFEQDLRVMAMKKIDKDPDHIIIDADALENPDAVPEEFKSLMKGEIHVAFSVSESDQKDYLVRNLVGLDPDEGSMTVSHYISSGDRMGFVHRDDDTVREDLTKSLLDLRQRIKKEHGAFEPKGAVYVSCVARARGAVEGSDTSEMTLVREIIGDVPLAGFYAGGEISNARLYGYTGILTVFL